MRHLFHSTTLRLTAWYTLILLCIGVLFSILVFQVSDGALQRGLGPRRLGEARPAMFETQDMLEWRKERYEEGRSSLIGRLILFNLFVLAAGAVGSYALARYTLRPVETAMELQGRFSSDAAHELRTPLTIMQSEIEVGLRDKKSSKASHEALLRSSLDEIHHMRTLTDRLLTLASSQELPLQPTELEDIVIDAVNRCIPLAQAKKIVIQNCMVPAKVLANEESLTDAIAILIENAIKYSPSKTTVILDIEHRHKAIEVCVTDEGPGIDPKDLPHIFDRFYRADTSRSRQNVPGHGLGLSIAKRIVQAHGGTITVQNNPTSGTCFRLSIQAI